MSSNRRVFGFNPRARVGRDIHVCDALETIRVVSIHAPAWGATRMDGGIRQDYRVSIHAPAWGATTSQAAAPPSSHCFNPRARVGRDDIDYAIVYDTVTFQSTRPRGARRLRRPEIGRVRVVSIHAPAWGATAYSRACERGRTRFNPRARVGRDPAGLQERASRPGFNPRARVGRDISDQYAHIDRARFHSTRPRGARRDRKFLGLAVKGVSIHAPAWGATTYPIGIYPMIRSFNPRARVGRDQARRLLPYVQQRFNPRARVGRDALERGEMDAMIGFQSTRPRGARR